MDEIKVGQEYDIETSDGSKYCLEIESETETYFFITLDGAAGLGVPKEEIEKLLEENKAVLVDDSLE